MPKLELLREAYKLNETEIQKSISRYLNLKGIFNWPTHAGQIIPAHTGVSDIVGSLPGNGRIIAIEVKLPGWKPPKEETKAYKHYLRQRNFLENIRKSNGIAFFATSVEEVISQLEVTRPLISKMDPGATEQGKEVT